MGMTMSQKILAHHAGLDRVEAGQLIECKLDLVLGNDITAPVAIGVFEDAGLTEVFDKNKIAIVLDHYTPCKDIKAAQLCATARTFARKHEIKNFFDVGTVGVEHALIPEKGLAIPGDCIIGAGSLVTKNTIIPDGSLVMGSPARIKRNLTWEEKLGIVENSKEYLAVSEEMKAQDVL